MALRVISHANRYIALFKLYQKRPLPVVYVNIFFHVYYCNAM